MSDTHYVKCYFFSNFIKLIDMARHYFFNFMIQYYFSNSIKLIEKYSPIITYSRLIINGIICFFSDKTSKTETHM
jgi:hypothetical protein